MQWRSSSITATVFKSCAICHRPLADSRRTEYMDILSGHHFLFFCRFFIEVLLPAVQSSQLPSSCTSFLVTLDIPLRATMKVQSPPFPWWWSDRGFTTQKTSRYLQVSDLLHVDSSLYKVYRYEGQRAVGVPVPCSLWCVISLSFLPAPVTPRHDIVSSQVTPVISNTFAYMHYGR